MQWTLIDSGIMAPAAVMAKDANLLQEVNHPILHLYEWDSPCLTYGYFTDPFQFLKKEAVDHYGIQMARRPTGGGILFHLTDYAFSILLPANHPAFSLNTLENYAAINGLVWQAIAPLMSQQVEFFDKQKDKKMTSHFCMAQPTCYDLIVKGKKLAGAAQRRTKHGLLHQGSLSLALPSKELLNELLIQNDKILSSMEHYTYHLLPSDWTAFQLQGMRQAVKQQLINHFAN